MESYKVTPSQHPPKAEMRFPGDKSLSHRAVMFGALSDGVSRFTNVLAGEDCVCTRKAFEEMGVPITSSPDGTELEVRGAGLKGLRAPQSDLYLGNSGTSMRLLMGVLAGQSFQATLTGDPSLSSRPMRRVGDWLRQMGASIEGRDGGNFAPITVRGGSLRAIEARLPVASAQVKSAILLAALYADGLTQVTEPVKSRDHTERFLKYFGTSIQEEGTTVSIRGKQRLEGRSFEIAGDISSAAFFMVMAALVPGSEISFRSILWNPTRTGVAEVLKRAGVRLGHLTERQQGPETVADFTIQPGALKAFEISKAELPSLIDEIPILCVLATQSRGVSRIYDAEELRVKESDRIQTTLDMLAKLGAGKNARAEGNTLIIEGPVVLRGAQVDSFKDHRIAMSAAVAALAAQGDTVIRDTECIATSFPTFFDLLRKCGAEAVRLTLS